MAPSPELRDGFRRETAVFDKAEADLALTGDAQSICRSSPEFLRIANEGCYDKQGMLSLAPSLAAIRWDPVGTRVSMRNMHAALGQELWMGLSLPPFRRRTASGLLFPTLGWGVSCFLVHRRWSPTLDSCSHSAFSGQLRQCRWAGTGPTVEY